MDIHVKVMPTHRANVLAGATIELVTDDGIVTIHDGRFLMNKAGIVWFSLPNFSIPTSGRQFQYKPSVELSAALFRKVTDAALAAFEAWQLQQGGGGQ